MVHQVPQDHREELGAREKLEILAITEFPEDLEIRDLLDLMVHLEDMGELVCVEQMELPASQEDPDSLEQRERLETTDHLVSTELLQPLAKMVLMDYLDSKDLKVN